MVHLKCLDRNCNGNMNLIGTALNGTLFYWCSDCQRLFIVSNTGAQNRMEYQMRTWQTPTGVCTWHRLLLSQNTERWIPEAFQNWFVRHYQIQLYSDSPSIVSAMACHMSDRNLASNANTRHPHSKKLVIFARKDTDQWYNNDARHKCYA